MATDTVEVTCKECKGTAQMRRGKKMLPCRKCKDPSTGLPTGKVTITKPARPS